MKTSEKSTWGGERDGSGRKPKLKFEARELFYMAIDERWDRILAKIDKYIERGDKDILKMLIEQRIGRPPTLHVLPASRELPKPILIHFDHTFDDSDEKQQLE